jgi:hypothetical protein
MNVISSKSRAQLIIRKINLKIAVIKRKIVHKLEARRAEISLCEEDYKRNDMVCEPAGIICWSI